MSSNDTEGLRTKASVSARRDENGRAPLDLPAGEGGFALATVMIVLGLLMGLTVTAHLASQAETRIGGNDYSATRSFYAAEAGAEHMLAELRELLSDGVLTAAKADSADDNPPNIPNFELEEYKAELDSGGVQNEKITQGPFSGMWSRTREVLVTSSVEGPNGSRTTVEL
ncbi:MAG: pilus assembly PilX N-terminal domain-containing protein, partial [Candidatus Palauibacterales bacterium]|nr:pilus assembly PilX N-terminal domain-containing protein [Candidatus Palauibacterales bacterium]